MCKDWEGNLELAYKKIACFRPMINFRGTSAHLTTFLSLCTPTFFISFCPFFSTPLPSFSLPPALSPILSFTFIPCTTQRRPKWSNYFADGYANPIDMPDVYFMTHSYPILPSAFLFYSFIHFFSQCQQRYKISSSKLYHRFFINIQVNYFFHYITN